MAHLLGAHAVSGFGDSFKTGGKVVKNVTGYDLCKLLAGSWGTLSVMTEATLKVMPKPEAERTLLLRGLGSKLQAPVSVAEYWEAEAKAYLKSPEGEAAARELDAADGGV